MMYTCLGQWGVIEYGPSSNANAKQVNYDSQAGLSKYPKEGRALQKGNNKDS